MGRPSKPSKRRSKTPKSSRGEQNEDGRLSSSRPTKPYLYTQHGNSRWYMLPSFRLVRVDTVMEMEYEGQGNEARHQQRT